MFHAEATFDAEATFHAEAKFKFCSKDSAQRCAARGEDAATTAAMEGTTAWRATSAFVAAASRPGATLCAAARQIYRDKLKVAPRQMLPTEKYLGLQGFSPEGPLSS